MYCIRCKEHTGTSSVKTSLTKNNRRMKKGTCALCGSIKCQFLKSDEGKKGSSSIRKKKKKKTLLGLNFFKE